MNYTAIIVEDNPVDAEILHDYLQKYFPEITIAAFTDSVSSIKTLVNQQSPQIVFMDIELVDGTSLDVLDSLNTEEVQLIFITSHNAFAIDAIRANAVDYIVKPVDATLLKKALQKAFGRIEINNAAKQTARGRVKKIAVPSANGLMLIEIEKIISLEAEGAYTNFILDNAKPFLASRTMGSFERELPSNMFMRIHDSCIVNRNFINGYLNSGILKMTDDTEYKVSVRKKTSFLRWLNSSI